MRGPPQSKKIKVVHLSSAHRADDTRIFWKECVSLARAGYDVCLVVPDDEGSARREGVGIVGVRRYAGRFGRMVTSTIAVVAAGLCQNGDLYHFHDPELIPGGLVLRFLGKRVIYDAHEDLPRDILFKDWIPGRLRLPVSRAAGAMEWIAGCALSGIVAATPIIAQRFPKGRAALVQNFARLAEFPIGNEPVRGRRRAVAYVGALTVERCAVEMVEAMAKVDRFSDTRLIVAGEISPRSLVDTLASSPGWSRVDYRGFQDRTGVRRVLGEASVGLAVFHPVQSYIESQPVKLFEYMAAGLPVIAADFPRFREIVQGNGCGICVPPRDPTAIAAAIEQIFRCPEEAAEMGRRGRDLVLRSCNWEREVETLFSFYDRVLGRNEPSAPAPAPAENAGNGACDVMISRQGDGLSRDEVRRIRMVYAERERKLRGTVKEDAANRGNQYLLHEYRERLARVLRERFERPLSECRVLDLGCGYGSLLGWFHEQGTPAENLVGVDLLPSRIAIARERFPAFTFVEANAEQFDLPDASFDLVPVFTVFSSILDRRMARNVAWNIRRVLAPHGAVVWYDMRYPNPWNPHLKAMTKARIKELFPSFALELETISLVPPLARRLGPFTTTAYPLFASIPVLRTHYIGLLRGRGMPPYSAAVTFRRTGSTPAKRK